MENPNDKRDYEDDEQVIKVKDDIKKFKQQLLQTASNPDNLPKILLEDHVSTEESDKIISMIRERSVSRQYEAPLEPRTQRKPIKCDERVVSELKEAFTLFDLNGDGYIDLSDLKATYVSLGQTTDEAQLKRMFSETSYPIDVSDFIELLGSKCAQLESEDVMIDALSQWDKDGTGFISEKRLRHDLTTWGDKFTEQEVDCALEEAPVITKKGQTMIDYIRFCRLLCGGQQK